MFFLVKRALKASVFTQTALRIRQNQGRQATNWIQTLEEKHPAHQIQNLFQIAHQGMREGQTQPARARPRKTLATNQIIHKKCQH